MGKETASQAVPVDLGSKSCIARLSYHPDVLDQIGGNMATAYPYILGILLGLLLVVIFKFSKPVLTTLHEKPQ